MVISIIQIMYYVIMDVMMVAMICPEKVVALLRRQKKQLGKPYKYGATGPDEFDCSGLVYYVFKETGKYTGQRLSAAGYRSVSTPVSQQEAQSGDLVFFIKSGNTHHVGIYIGNGQMIHAPRTGDVVKISDVWRNGEIVTYGRLAH